ncbi:MAG TPA: sigma-70 family RNA polymerase sigma factor, partial [Tepidisphaeraceae bacterium]
MTDRELLGAYARDGDQAAFGELVRRHIDLVYNACVRQARGNRHLAEDATQAVFLLLAQRAGRIGANVVLPGWLYQTARHAAANAVRAEDRRRRHERAAAQIMPLTTPTQHDDPPAWERAAPILDDAINALSVHDRDAVLLRYFQGKGVREMAVALGVSEDAAKQRVSRAVERLRRAFARRGVSLTGAAALVVILETANAQAAPPALISAASALGSASAATAIAGPVSAIAKGVLMMSHLKTLAATFAVVVLVGLGGAAAALLRGAPPPSAPKPAAAAPVVPVAAPAASPYHIAYANGVTVDFLAVSVVPSRLQPFWYPDGSRGVEPPYESRGPGPGYMRAGGKSVYELTARISGAAAAGDDSPPYLRTRAINGITIAVAASPFKGAATLGDLRVFECSVGAGDETLKFGLGIAANTWQPVRTFKTPGVYGSGPDKVEVIELSPRDRPSRNGSWFRAQLAPSEDALRLVAIDESGKAHVSRGGWIMAGAWHGVEAVFPGLAREKVREFRIERCAFEWQAVKDVHLKPAGDLASVLAQARVKRLIGDELRCKPEDARKVDAAIETLGRLNLDDVDAWGGAVRDLADVGAAAVPAICAELQRTSRPYTRSALAVALRAIDDPRAVPALAAALADCPFSPNDYGGLRVKDPAILHFMLGLQRDPGYAGPGDPTINFGRPVNEITAALEQLSGGHSEGFAPARKDDRKVFQDTAHRWQTWWDQNGGKFTAGLPMLRI